MPNNTTRSVPARLWQPLLVAAVVVLLVGIVALVLHQSDEPSSPGAASDPTHPVSAPQESGTESAPDASSEPTTYDAESALADVIDAVVTDDRAGLVDQDVIADGEWDQLVDMAEGGEGSGSTCRDNGGGTQDCEIDFAANPDTVYYAILEPASNSYGWRVTYVSIAHG